MPTIITIKEYTRGYKNFPIGTKINVTTELAQELAEAGICEPIKVTKKIKKKTKKTIENGLDK
jgi:hypothetical protein